jgi:hypothetical protein
MVKERGDQVGRGSNPVSISSISSTSFYQQDQNYWNRQEAQAQVSTANDALISEMGSAEANLAKGLASIANQTALNRVNAEIAAAEKSATSGSSPTSSTSSNPFGSPAIGTGTVPLTRGTSLLTLGIPPAGAITVSDGTNTTTYTSTGSDTVGDLINAIDANVFGNANVTAGLNSHGDLVITGKNDTDPVTVGGLFASNVGFGTGNNTFQPTAPSSSSSNTAASVSSSNTSTSSTGASSSGKSSSTGSSAGASTDSAPALQTGSTAASLLTADGVNGNLVDMLA